MTFLCRSILLCGLVFLLGVPAFSQAPASGPAPASMVVGAIKAANVRGTVKTLNRAAGSTFSVSTPAGAAGIRGTTFRIVYRPTGDGQAFLFELSTSEGVVFFEGITGAGLASIDVPFGQQLSLIAQINP